MAHKSRGTENRKDFLTVATGGHVVRHAKRLTEVLEVRTEEDKQLEKTTGDVKEEEKKGLAKASPRVRKVIPKTEASEEEKQKALAEATTKVEKTIEK